MAGVGIRVAGVGFESPSVMNTVVVLGSIHEAEPHFCDGARLSGFGAEPQQPWLAKKRLRV